MVRELAAPLPLRAGPSLSTEAYARLRRRLALDGCKWDLQLVDSPTVAPFPLLMSGETWSELAESACALASELEAAERELSERPELHERLAVPRAIRRVLSPGFVGQQLLRFDFHLTDQGWRISEVNADVPGGFVESSLLPRLMDRGPGGTPVGDPSGRFTDAIARAADSRPVALLSAPRFLEDQQVVSWLQRELERRGAIAHLATPSQIRWRDGEAWLLDEGPLGAVVRFFQAEWLPRRGIDWRSFFRGARTPLFNPGIAILGESKRFPLSWPALSTPLPTWRRLLPETRDPRDCPLDEEWILKPTYGNTGDDVTFPEDERWARVVRSARRRPMKWVAQRRFRALAVDTPDGPRVPCLGVYVLDGEALGVYGRLARGALIDWSAQDVAVLSA